MIDVGAILMGAFAGFIYASVFYLKNRTRGEEFDIAKYIATIIWGMVIGAILSYTGVEVTEEKIVEAFAQYFMLVVVTENIIKAIFKIKG